ncbi:MAG: hypothetical protein ACYC4Q_12385, partial [Victivallaceae bacterium]
ILAELAVEQSGFCALDQLFELAAIFALRGDQRAKHAICRRFIKGSEGSGEEAVLKVYGLKGLLLIAKAQGKELLINPEEWEDRQDSFLVDNFQKDNPQIKVYAELEKVAADDKFVRKYLDTIKKNKSRPAAATNKQNIPTQVLRKELKRWNGFLFRRV